MHTSHSPSQRPPGTWRRTTAVTSVVLPAHMPAVSATSLAQTLRVAHRAHCTHPPLNLCQSNRKQSGSLPEDVALHVAGYVAGVVAGVVALSLCSASAHMPVDIPLSNRHGYASSAHALRNTSASLANEYPSAMRFSTASLPATLHSGSNRLSASYAERLRLRSGNTPGVSSIQLRLHSGRLPHMMRKVAGIPATESPVSHRLTVALSTARTTAVQAVIL